MHFTSETTADGALQDMGQAGGPVGYWGLSMGSAIGMPFVAAEPRIGAAVFGLAVTRGWARRRPGSPSPSSSCCNGTTR
ncbi:MAG: hypothetical protein ACRDND_06440 [Streptosporangiaceae bacterium]